MAGSLFLQSAAISIRSVPGVRGRLSFFDGGNIVLRFQGCDHEIFLFG